MKKILITGLLYLLLCPILFSQAGKLNDVFVKGVLLRQIVNESNGYIVLGKVQMKDRANLQCNLNAKGYLIWLGKFDDKNKLLWERCYGGNGEDDPKKIVPDGKGGFVIFSTSSSKKGDVNCNMGYYNIWLLHIDSVGNILDSRCFGGSAYDALWDAIRTKDGGYVFAVESFSKNGDFPAHYGGFLSEDIWVVKLDSLFNIVWKFHWGGSDVEIFPNLVEYPDGSLAIAVASYSDDYDVTSNYYYADAWIIKLDTGGKKVWQRHYGAYNSQDIPQDIIITPPVC
jgi:hypothetical protein